MTEPREYTEEEVREMFLSHICNLVKYWQTTPADYKYLVGIGESQSDWRVRGVVSSIMVTLDGFSGGSVGFAVIPRPHPDDLEFHKSQGENWYRPIPDGVELQDIAGDLSSMFHEHMDRLKK